MFFASLFTCKYISSWFVYALRRTIMCANVFRVNVCLECDFVVFMDASQVLILSLVTIISHMVVGIVIIVIANTHIQMYDIYTCTLLQQAKKKKKNSAVIALIMMLCFFLLTFLFFLLRFSVA